jgi:hypothetical protein
MPEVKRFSLVRPTVQTHFYIDFTWWKSHDGNWRVYLQSCLCAEHQVSMAKLETNETIDWVDADTAEVQSVDGLQHVLISHCARQKEFLADHTSMIDGVFRLLLANGNVPMTPVELGEHLNRPAEVILRTLAGGTVYQGIRPGQS